MLLPKKMAIKTYEDFKARAEVELSKTMERICRILQEKLKVAGDWKIYPFAVHDLIAKGRVEVTDKQIYIDDIKQLRYGYRMNDYG